MCEDLVNALDAQEQLGADTTKGALMLFKAASKSISKIAKNMQAHIDESDKRLQAISDDVKKLTQSFEEYKTDATKYRLIVEIAKALFGDVRRSILTLVYVSVIVGIVHISDILDLLKALI